MGRNNIPRAELHREHWWELTGLAIAAMIAALSGAPANTVIHCTPNIPGISAGYAEKGSPPTMLLSGLTCAQLEHSRAPEVFMFGVAVHLVAHESSHLRGLWTEYGAETRAERIMPRVLAETLHRLGFGDGQRFRSVYRRALHASEVDHAGLPWNYLHPVRV